MNGLPDIIDYGLKILFIGFNPGLKSSMEGHHYAGKSNSFWKLLYESGLTPYQFKLEEDRKLLEFGFGSTNIAGRPTKSAAELTKAEFKSGAEDLKVKLLEFSPQIACYVGIGVYRAFSLEKEINCGLQSSNVLNGITDYVCSSPSGLNRIPYQEQLECFRGLKNIVFKR